VKFGVLAPDGATVPYDYGNVFCRQPSGKGERLVIGPTADQIALLCELASDFPKHQYYVLYVLVLSHAEREGRYQSPLIESYDDLELFLWTFQTFLEGDGRHHIWIASAISGDLLVYDQHDIVFAYGNIRTLEERLRTMGYREQEFWYPVPHFHAYPPANVRKEQELLEYYEWHWSELQEGDEQN
jgi:hypothetical protein